MLVFVLPWIFYLSREIIELLLLSLITGETCGRIQCLYPHILKKDQRRTYLMILLQCFFFFCVCVYSDFLYKASVVGTSRCNSNGYPQHMPL